MRVGFIVNPVAGLGGRVGLKGTDGHVEEALKRGAEPVAPDRARRFLENADKNLSFVTCSNKMGADYLEGFPHTVVYEAGVETSAEDTIGAVNAFIAEDAELIVFLGGDGTARDIYSATADTPMLGVPSGVKMHSSVFAVNPEAAAEIVNAYAEGAAGLHDAEIVDVDEDAYRHNELRTHIYGYVKTPYVKGLTQATKSVYHTRDEEDAKNGIASFAKEFMSDGSAYIMGAGSTTKAIADALGAKKTLLGVDVVKDAKTVVEDAGEKELLDAVDRYESVKIMVTPIGAQGFVFGRGTQQMSPEVIRCVGVDNIIYVGTPHKVNAVPYLLVDTGDVGLDRELSGYRRVVIGYRMAQRKDVKEATQKT